MISEIDVSGGDLLSKDYVVCIANKNGIIRGFKFDESLVRVLCAKYGQGLYKYKKSKKDKSTFKVRLYSIVIYYLFKSLKDKISLILCRDFTGRENFKFFLDDILKLKVDDRIYFTKLDRTSIAHRYAFLMRHDNKNKIKTYIKLDIKDFDKWLIK